MDIGFSGAAALRPLCRLVFATVAIAPLILAPAVSKAQSAAPEQPAAPPSVTSAPTEPASVAVTVQSGVEAVAPVPFDIIEQW